MLSATKINELITEADGKAPREGSIFRALVKLTESEVRKQDEALIRQLVDALYECKDSTQERIDTLTASGMDKHKPIYFRTYVLDLQRANEVIKAGYAWLEGKP